MTLIRTKKQPDVVLDVDDAELLDLTRMGLILEVVQDTAAAPSAPVVPASPPSLPSSSPSTAASTSTDEKGKQ